MEKALLIINPSSGGEKAKDYEKQAIEKLEELFDKVEVKYTEKAGDARDFAKNAAREKYNSVFVMGGDGTVNEGISGLAEEDYRPDFGFFPLGTVNDLARALKISLEPEEAINELNINRMKKIDIGKINDSYFMNVVAIGVIPEAINDVEVEDKTKFGKLAYFISGFKSIKDAKAFLFELEIDNEKIDISSSTILIGLTNSIGGFESILPEAEVDDGKLHVIYLKDKRLIDSIKAVPNLITGVSDSNDNVGYRTCEEINIKLLENETLSVNADGDEGDKLPVSIKVLPSHISVYCGIDN